MMKGRLCKPSNKIQNTGFIDAESVFRGTNVMGDHGERRERKNKDMIL